MAIRYRLRADLSVVRRPDATVQVGLDVADQVLLPDAPDGAAPLLRSLRAGATLAGLERSRGAVPRAWLRRAVDKLSAGGLLVPDQGKGPAPPVIVGDGTLADAVASAAGVAAVPASAWSPEAHPGRLVVLCPGTVEVDRVAARELARAGRPHLVVRAEPERAVVGPFVIPGTACVACTDLVRRDLDPGWPHVLVQLCRTRHAPARAWAAWAAGTALAQAAAWSSGGLPDTVGGTLELSCADGVLGARRWPMRPDCLSHAPEEQAA